MAQDAPLIRVTVYEDIEGGHTTYHYAVANKGDRPITIVTIGVDVRSGDFTLTVPPSGWTSARGLPQGSVGAPAGWTARLIFQEDSNNFAIEWRTGSRGIAPGHRSAGFRVVLPQPVPLYTSTGWDTTDDLGGSTTGELERLRPGGPEQRSYSPR